MLIKPAILPDAGGFDVANSGAFASEQSDYLSRTPSVAGNTEKFTYSTWVKRSKLGTEQLLFGESVSGTDFTVMVIDANDNLKWWGYPSASGGRIRCTAKLRDVAEFYHVVFAIDTDQATATDRVKIYLNGVQLTDFLEETYPTLSYATGINDNVLHKISGTIGGTNYYFDGYLSEVHFIDGQSLTPDNFAETDPQTDQWVAKEYTGTYGTNGFYLNFQNGVSLGEDSSGNGNDWTNTNVTQSTDAPTNNHAILNELVPTDSANNAGRSVTNDTARSTIDALFGAYWEISASGGTVTAGVVDDGGTTNTTTIATGKTYGFRLSSSGNLDYINITDAGSWTSITTGLTDVQLPYISCGSGVTGTLITESAEFTGTAPTGYTAISTKNLPEIPKPYDVYVAPTTENDYSEGTYTGNGSTDGPFVYLGYEPTHVVIDNTTVYTNPSTVIDFLSNGFKLRSTTNNTNAASYAWEGWVDQDFKYGRGVIN